MAKPYPLTAGGLGQPDTVPDEGIDMVIRRFVDGGSDGPFAAVLEGFGAYRLPDSLSQLPLLKLSLC